MHRACRDVGVLFAVPRPDDLYHEVASNLRVGGRLLRQRTARNDMLFRRIAPPKTACNDMVFEGLLRQRAARNDIPLCVSSH
jgi:hypothetical protein